MIAGFRLPPEHPTTENERAWIEMLRIMTDDAVPRLTLRLVQDLRRILREAEGQRVNFPAAAPARGGAWT